MAWLCVGPPDTWYVSVPDHLIHETVECAKLTVIRIDSV